MGALSSWGMLALTHHVLVQIAASWSGRTLPFKDYALLGDDFVIWCKSTARNYLMIMKGLGLEVNLFKSIISKKGLGLEFAKRTILFRDGVDTDVSPIPLKEYSAALETSASFVAFTKKYNLPDNVIRSLLGLGYKSKPTARRWQLFQVARSIPTCGSEFQALLDRVLDAKNSPSLKSVIAALLNIAVDLRKSISKAEKSLRLIVIDLDQLNTYDYTGMRSRAYDGKTPLKYYYPITPEDQERNLETQHQIYSEMVGSPWFNQSNYPKTEEKLSLASITGNPNQITGLSLMMRYSENWIRGSQILTILPKFERFYGILDSMIYDLSQIDLDSVLSTSNKEALSYPLRDDECIDMNPRTIAYKRENSFLELEELVISVDYWIEKFYKVDSDFFALQVQTLIDPSPISATDPTVPTISKIGLKEQRRLQIIWKR
jgi:hypothetical protein